MRPVLTLLFLSTVISALGQNEISVEKPIKTVERIFKEYVKFSEGTDSPDNKAALAKALDSLQRSFNSKDLSVLLDVWMYYDPTDFPTRQLIEPIFYKNRSAAIEAIDKRIKHKKKWEKKDGAPFSELFSLKDQLLKNG